MKHKTPPIIIYIQLLCILMLTYHCSDPAAEYNTIEQAGYLNHNDTVKYLGIEACKECHFYHYQSYLSTGMGLSFDSATKSKSASVISPNLMLYDSRNNLHYKPYWNSDVLKLEEYRLSGVDKIHSRTQVVDFIVGSGQHTNSHIYVVNGYAHQVPFTFYTQDQRFDFPPGFEGGQNSRFNRKIGLECMSCHNAFPKMVIGSENKYSHIPGGIDCERCHGPGEVHVKLKKKGVIVDTSLFIDYSIVNPANLSPVQQFDICTRCHLQGTMVLKPGKSFYDFKPGMELSKVMDIFMPRHKGGKEDFIMASHVERLKESQCYEFSGEKLNCLTCHKAHISFREIERSSFNRKCSECHNENSRVCNADKRQRDDVQDDCISCHMRESNSRDIPHVRIHDHKISIPPTPEQLSSERKFVGLVSVNNPETDNLSIAKGYLLEYEAYEADPTYLDSSYYYLQNAAWINKQVNWHAIINYYYLKEDYPALVSFIEFVDSEKMLSAILVNQDYSNYDAWAAYRIGQAIETTGNLKLAHKYYQKATLLAKYNLEFQNKLGSIQIAMQDLKNAKETYDFILSENPLFASAHVNYGYTLLLLGNIDQAEYHYDIALSLDPDQLQALLNKAGLYFIKQDQEQGMEYIDQVLILEPDHPQANMIKRNFK
ncbi:MAG: pilus assembly protein TadD [Bacteroidota bacterium]|nr:pilus assembly protein TadD [Bacteroidota bacterium]